MYVTVFLLELAWLNHIVFLFQNPIKYNTNDINLLKFT